MEIELINCPSNRCFLELQMNHTRLALHLYLLCIPDVALMLFATVHYCQVLFALSRNVLRSL